MLNLENSFYFAEHRMTVHDLCFIILCKNDLQIPFPLVNGFFNSSSFLLFFSLLRQPFHFHFRLNVTHSVLKRYYFSWAHSPRPRLLAVGPIYVFTPPPPRPPPKNYFFTAPNDEMTFSWPSSIKNYLFTAPSNNNSLPCLFLLL